MSTAPDTRATTTESAVDPRDHSPSASTLQGRGDGQESTSLKGEYLGTDTARQDPVDTKTSDDATDSTMVTTTPAYDTSTRDVETAMARHYSSATESALVPQSRDSSCRAMPFLLKFALFWFAALALILLVLLVLYVLSLLGVEISKDVFRITYTVFYVPMVVMLIGVAILCLLHCCGVINIRKMMGLE